MCVCVCVCVCVCAGWEQKKGVCGFALVGVCICIFIEGRGDSLTSLC